MTDSRAKRKVKLGPSGQIGRANIARIRKAQGLTLQALSERLDDLHPLSYVTLSEIERGGRRVDVDDLVTISNALGVCPSELLSRSGEESLPPVAPQADLVPIRRVALGAAEARSLANEVSGLSGLLLMRLNTCLRLLRLGNQLDSLAEELHNGGQP